MRFSKSIFCSSFLLLTIYSIKATPINDFNKGLTEFSTELYLQCIKEKPGNVILSPLSVSSALALLSQATDGSTFEQLKQGLHLSNDKSITANQFLEHCETLERNAGAAKFSIANRIYVQQGHQLKNDFKEIAVSKFKSGVETLNFTDSAKSAAAINHFVEEKTNGKIKELFGSDQFSSDTRSVLVNAIYFKGNWEEPFNMDNNFKGDFYNSETEKVSVDFMYKDSDFNAARIQELDATALELKYANSSMAFMIVLPNNRNGLSTLETKLKDYDLTKIGEKLQPDRFMTSIPKFKVEYEIKLNDVLKNMGMAEIFSDSANLSGLLETNEQLKVSNVVHKAFLEFDENGSEAGGAAGFDIDKIFGGSPSFTADHPFMFFLRDTETNTIIFSGRIEKF